MLKRQTTESGMTTTGKLRFSTLMIVAIGVALLAGCSDDDENRGPQGVRGTLRVEDQTGSSRPTAGQVVYYDNDIRRATHDVPDTGEFQTLLQPGKYEVIAAGNKVVCGREEITVSDGEFTTVTFVCSTKHKVVSS